MKQTIRGSGQAAEWESEAMLADPSIAVVVSTVSATIGIFVGFTWIADDVIGLPWFKAIWAVIAAMVLVQGLPSDLSEALSASQRRQFLIPVWIARTIVIGGCVLVYGVVLALPSPTQWWFLLTVSLIVGPLIWFALLQVRQSALLAAIGKIRPGQVAVVTCIVLVQISLWALVLITIFGDFGIAIASLMVLVAVAVHIGGNLMIAKQLAFRFEVMTRA